MLTGIAHDIDETLAALVAYQKLKTPTAVSEFLIQRLLIFDRLKIDNIHLEKYKN